MRYLDSKSLTNWLSDKNSIWHYFKVNDECWEDVLIDLLYCLDVRNDLFVVSFKFLYHVDVVAYCSVSFCDKVRKFLNFFLILN